MADKLSKGSNSSTFKLSIDIGALSNVSVDIGVIRMQDKATETRKTAILTEREKKKKKKQKKKKNKTKNKTKKKKTTNQITFEKKFYVNSTELYMEFACLLEQTLYLNSKRVIIICLIFIQPGACCVRYWLVSARKSWPVRKQEHRKGINFYRCFDLLLHASCKNMLSKQCKRES